MPRYFLTAVALCGLLGSMNPARADKPLVWRNGIHGREFSEVGRLYFGRDKLLHIIREAELAQDNQHLDATARNAPTIMNKTASYNKPCLL